MKFFFKSSKGKDGYEFVEPEFFQQNVKSSDTFRIVNLDGQKEPVSFSSLVNLANEMELDVLILNLGVDPKIVKIIDVQKYFYELKKAKKENEKKQKAMQVKNKEIRISLGISEHDLDMKINHTKKFADEGCKIKFTLRLRGREGAGPGGKEYVQEFFKKVLSKFEGYSCDGVKSVGNSIWTEITK